MYVLRINCFPFFFNFSSDIKDRNRKNLFNRMNGICKNEVEYDMNMPENLKKTKEGKNKKALKLNVFKAFCCIFCGDGAHGGI